MANVASHQSAMAQWHFRQIFGERDPSEETADGARDAAANRSAFPALRPPASQLMRRVSTRAASRVRSPLQRTSSLRLNSTGMGATSPLAIGAGA
jgi:hypothetical protein